MPFGEYRRKSGPMSSADKVHKHQIEHSKVDRLPCEDPKRRARLEKDALKWLRWYCPEAFTRPFEKPHVVIIEGAIHASRTGGRFNVAAQRGIGKSTCLWGVVIMLALTGEQPFPVCVPWAAGALKRAFKFWKNALCFNPRLLADYPDICAPFAHCKGSSQKLAHTIWRDTDQPTGAQLAVGEGLIALPDNRGCIGGATINGNPRGLNYPMPDGRVLRPTLAFLDDVQDRGTAKSQLQIRDTIDVIDGDVAGMGEAGRELPMLMSGNCIEPDDVMAHYLASERWKSIRIPCVESWPAAWDEGKGAAFKLWSEWWSRTEHGDGATAFYRKHKRQMTDGMVLTAPGTYRKSKGIPDAFCAVMRNYFQMGPEAFAAEAQQEPLKRGVTLYTLTPAAITARADKSRRAGVLPDWTQLVLAATDINPSYALTTAVAVFNREQRSAVVWYGTEPMAVEKSWTDTQKKSAIMAALENHGKNTLTRLPRLPDLWMIDGGGSPQGTVVDFAAQSQRTCGIPALCAFGRASTRYYPRSAGNKIYLYEQACVVRKSATEQWCLLNADYWREQSQRAWLAPIGAPGSCDLPDGNHREFAEQCVREILQGKAETGGKMVYVWATQPGPHDYGDCMSMLYAAAALKGVGTGGQVAKPTGSKRRRPTGVTVIPL
jgi:hypothetical protein